MMGRYTKKIHAFGRLEIKEPLSTKEIANILDERGHYYV